MILLHWGIAAFAILHLINAFTLHMLQDQDTALIFMELHRGFGLLLLLATLIRVYVRFREPLPKLDENIPTWQKWAAKVNHFSLYIILLLGPIIGWMYTNSIGQEVSFFWLLTLPNIVSPNISLAADLLVLHKYIAATFIVMLLIHCAATIYNKNILKNRCLSKITPIDTYENFRSYLSVWLKLTFASLISFLCAVCIGFSGIIGTDNVKQHGIELYEKSFRSFSLISSAQSQWSNFYIDLLANKKISEKKIKRITKIIGRKLKSGMKRIENEETKIKSQFILNQIKYFSEEIKRNFQNNIVGVPDSLQVVAGKINKDFTGVVKELNKVGRVQRNKFETLSASQTDYIVFVVVSASCLSIIIIIFLSSSISIQIAQAKEFAILISKGKYDNKVEVTGNSDLAELIKALLEMRNSIRKQIHDITSLQGDSANEKLLYQSHLKSLGSEITNFESETTQIINSFDTSVNEISNIASEMTEESSRSLKSCQSVFSSSSQSSEKSIVTSEAAQNLVGSMNEISDKVLEAKNIASNSADEAKDALTNMNKLEQVTDSIGSILKLINEIADQTNLLALNATIEAARAGEAGRGFSIVAAEVKELSTQTAKATEEITSKIKDLQTTSKSASSKITSVTEKIGDVDEYTSIVVTALQEQKQLTEKISENMNFVADDVSNISQNIDVVEQATKSADGISVTMSSMSKKLHENTTNMKDKINNFVEKLKIA